MCLLYTLHEYDVYIIVIIYSFWFCFQATRSVSLFPVVSLMWNTLSCSQVEQLMIAGNDEFGFTHISDPLHLSPLGFSKRIKCIWRCKSTIL